MRGNPPEELIERNQNLIKDYESHRFSQAELVEKYQITRQRIWRIVSRHKKRQVKDQEAL